MIVSTRGGFDGVLDMMMREDILTAVMNAGQLLGAAQATGDPAYIADALLIADQLGTVDPVSAMLVREHAHKVLHGEQGDVVESTARDVQPPNPQLESGHG